MKYLVLLSTAILMLSACKNDDKQAGKQEKAAQGDSVLALDLFEKPDTVKGCGSFFTHDPVDTTTGEDVKYIFASNLVDFGMIRVNNKDVYLNMLPEEAKEDSANNSYIDVYEGSGYKLILKIQQVENYDKGGFFKGTLEIISGDLRKTYNVYGHAGC
jgi:hypothetical protein